MPKTALYRILSLAAVALLSAACGDAPTAPTAVPQVSEGVSPPPWLTASTSTECITSVFTPNGTAVRMTDNPSPNPNDSIFDEQLTRCKAGCTRMQFPRDPYYDCHSYAFIDGGTLGMLCNSHKWLSSVDMQVYLSDGSYVETNSGDKCATVVNTGQHTGRIQFDSNGNRIYHSSYPELGELIVSKWGEGHLVKHYREDGEFPSMSGYPKYYKRADSTCGDSPPPADTPVATSITGPIELYIGQGGTWKANPSGGNGSYSCTWDLKTAEHGWIRVSSQQSYSTTMNSHDGYLSLRATCSSNGSTATDSHYVSCIDCSGSGDMK